MRPIKSIPEVISFKEVERAVHARAYIHESDDLGGDGRTDVGAEYDAYRLTEGEYARSDKTYRNNNSSCRTLDNAGHYHSEQEAHHRLVGHLG